MFPFGSRASKASVEVKPKDESKNRTTMAQVVSLDIDPKQKPIASCRFCLVDCSLGSALLQVQSEERVAERELIVVCVERGLFLSSAMIRRWLGSTLLLASPQSRERRMIFLDVEFFVEFRR
ncbi:unnamed protein product [Camellia sinensis]